MVQKTLFSAWPISCHSPRPLTIPCDSHLYLNTECTSVGGIPHFVDSISFKTLPPNFPYPSRRAAGVVTIALFWWPSSSSTLSLYYPTSDVALYNDLENINYCHRVFLMLYFHNILNQQLKNNIIQFALIKFFIPDLVHCSKYVYSKITSSFFLNSLKITSDVILLI